jgi:hypothetical protein
VLVTDRAYNAAQLQEAALAINQHYAGLDFGAEAHMNIPNIVFSRACSEPNREHPRWSLRRIDQTCRSLIERNRLRGELIVDKIVPFDDLPTEYPRIASDPQTVIKLGVLISSVTTLAKRINEMAKSLDELLGAVTAQTTQITSLALLTSGIKAQLDAALAGELSPDQQAKVDAIFAEVDANTAAIVTAINANDSDPNT